MLLTTIGHTSSTKFELLENYTTPKGRLIPKETILKFQFRDKETNEYEFHCYLSDGSIVAIGLTAIQVMMLVIYAHNQLAPEIKVIQPIPEGKILSYLLPKQTDGFILLDKMDLSLSFVYVATKEALEVAKTVLENQLNFSLYKKEPYSEREKTYEKYYWIVKQLGELKKNENQPGN